MSERNWAIPHSRPTLGPQERQAVLDVLASEHLSDGPRCRQLEKALVGAMGSRCGAVVSSGLAALHLAMLAMDVQLGDEVIVPTYSCEALLDAVMHCRAKPVIVDVDAQTGNIRPIRRCPGVRERRSASDLPPRASSAGWECCTRCTGCCRRPPPCRAPQPRTSPCGACRSRSTRRSPTSRQVPWPLR